MQRSLKVTKNEVCLVAKAYTVQTNKERLQRSLLLSELSNKEVGFVVKTTQLLC